MARPSFSSLRQSNQRRPAAFTVLEIIVVLFIIFLMMVLAAGAIFKHMDRREIEAEKKRLELPTATPAPAKVIIPKATPAATPALRAPVPDAAPPAPVALPAATPEAAQGQ